MSLQSVNLPLAYSWLQKMPYSKGFEDNLMDDTASFDNHKTAVEPLVLRRQDCSSDGRFWKGLIEGKQLATGLTVLLYATEEVGAGPK